MGLRHPGRAAAHAVVFLFAAVSFGPAARAGAGPDAPGRAGPVVRVRAALPGHGATDVAALLAGPTEKRLAAIPSVSGTRSASTRGGVAADAFFPPGTDEAAALQSVRDAVSAAVLPEGARTPEIEVLAGEGDRVALLVVGSRDAAIDLAAAAAKLGERLEREPGVRGVEIIGAARPRIEILADGERLATMGVTAGVLLSALKDALDAEPPAPAEDLRRVPVGGWARRIARVADVAEVRVAAGRDSFAIEGGHPVVVLRARFRAGSASPIPGGDLGPLRALLPEGVTIARWDEAASLAVDWFLPGEAGPEAAEKTARALAAACAPDEAVAWFPANGPESGGRLLVRTGGGADRRLAEGAPPGVTLRFCPPGEEPISVAVMSIDPEAREAAARDVEAGLRALDGIASALRESAPFAPEVKVAVDPERATALGITEADVRGQIAPLLGFVEIGRTGGRPVVLGIGDPPHDPGAFPGFLVRTVAGPIPLGEIATVTVVAAPKVVRHVDGLPATILTVRVDPSRDRPAVLRAVREYIEGALRPDVTFRIAGARRD